MCGTPAPLADFSVDSAGASRVKLTRIAHVRFAAAAGEQRCSTRAQLVFAGVTVAAAPYWRVTRQHASRSGQVQQRCSQTICRNCVLVHCERCSVTCSHLEQFTSADLTADPSQHPMRCYTSIRYRNNYLGCRLLMIFITRFASAHDTILAPCSGDPFPTS